MKRLNFILPILLCGGFLSLYVPWQIEENARFRTEGPGRLSPSAKISWLRLYPDRELRETIDANNPKIAGVRHFVLRDLDSIARVLSLLALDDGNWDRSARRPAGGSILHFPSPEPGLARLDARIGKDFAVCGEYTKSLPEKVILQIQSEFLKFGVWQSE